MAYSPTEFGANPLAADDSNLNNPRSIEFGASPAGLDLNGAPAAPLGLEGMPNINTAELDQQIAQMANMPLFRPSTQSTEAPVYYSPSTGNMVVNGFSFNERNASQALASEEYARQPRREFTLPDTANDWRPMSTVEYSNYIDSIRNPGFGRRMGEAWEHAWRGTGDIALGASLAVNPNWEWAQTARQNILREYEENAPFMLGLRDIQNPGDAATWASQMLIQAAPWVVETIASMAAGALVGGAVSGGVGAPAGAVEGFVAKEAIRRSTMAMLRSNLQRGASAYASALRSTGARTLTREQVIAHAGEGAADDVNRFFNFAERSFHLSRGAREPGNVLGSLGAQVGSAGSNYLMGVGDIRNTIADAGGDPTSAESVAAIWGLALPYAAIESVGDLILTQPLSRIVPDFMEGPSRIGNALRHGGLNFASEAIQESAQNQITGRAAANSLNQEYSADPVDLLEVALAGGLGGFGAGSVIGAMGPTTARAAPTTPTTPAGAPPSAGPTGTPGVPGMEDREWHDAGLDLDMSHFVPGMSPAVTMGTPTEYTPPTIINNDPNDIPEYPGAPDQEELVPGFASVARPPGWPPPAPPGVVGGNTAGLIPEAAPVVPPPAYGPEQRTTGDIYQSLADGQPVSREEINRLYAELTDMVMKNPTNERYLEAKAQVRDIMASGSGAVTDENSPEFQSQFPELAGYTANNPRAKAAEPTTSPMDEAQPQRAGGMPVDNPIMEDGLPKYGPHRLKAPKDEQGNIIAPKAEQLKKKKRPSKRKRAKKKAIEAAKKQDARITMAEAGKSPETSDEQVRHDARIATSPFGRRSQEEFDANNPLRETKRELRRKENQARERDKLRDIVAKRKEEKQGKKVEADNVERLRTYEERAQESASIARRGTFDDINHTANNLDDAFDKDVRFALTNARKLMERDDNPADIKSRLPSIINKLQEHLDGRVQEQSAERLPGKEQPSSSEATAANDTAGDRTAGPRAEEAELQPGPVQTPEVDNTRIGKARTTLEAAAKTEGKNARQKAAGMLSRMRSAERAGRAFKTEQKWATVDGVRLTAEELTALIQQFDGEKKPSTQEAKKAIRFADDIVDAFRINKGYAAEFAKWVVNHRAQAEEWLTTEHAKRHGGVKLAVEQALRDAPMRPPQAAALSTDRLEIPDISDAIKIKPLDSKADKAAKTALVQDLNELQAVIGLLNTDALPADLFGLKTLTEGRAALDRVVRRLSGLKSVNNNELFFWMTRFGDLEKEMLNAQRKAFSSSLPKATAKSAPSDRKIALWKAISDIELDRGSLPKGWQDQVIEQDKKNFANRLEVAKVLQSLLRGTGAESDAARAYAPLRGYFPKDTPKPTTTVGKAPEESGLTVKRVKDITNKVQKNINPDTRFRSVDVFENKQELMDKADAIMLTANDGREMSLLDYAIGNIGRLLAEAPGLAEYPHDVVARMWLGKVFEVKAAVVPDFNALVVIKDNIKDEEELVSILEHEYITHFGLAAVFPNDQDRGKFMHRLAAVPGMGAKLKQLLKTHPIYETIKFVDQIEEVLAYHSMEGPLAVKKLLEAPEGIDPATRMTLWDELVTAVVKWLKDVFGLTREPADLVMDNIVMALRRRAITGGEVDLNATLDTLGVASFEEILANTDFSSLKTPKAAAATPSTPEDARKLLFGTETNPGRPYTPQPWIEDMFETLRSNEDLVEKAKELANKNGTSAKEGLRAIGRNIEAMNNMAQRSVLIEKLMRMMHDTISVARRIMTKRQETRQYAVKSAQTAFLRKRFGDKAPGSTQAQRDAYNKMAVIATNSKMSKATDEIVRQAPRILVRQENGTYDFNRDVFEKLLEQGTFTKAEFEAGIEQFTVSGDGKSVSNGVAKLPQSVIDAGYDIYVAETRHMAESKLEELEHGIVMLNQLNDVVVSKIIRDNKFSAADEEFTAELLTNMYKLYTDIAFFNNDKKDRTGRNRQKEVARQVLVELMRTMHSKEKLQDWLDPNKKRNDKTRGPRSNDAFKWREQVDMHDDVKPFASRIRWFLQNDATGVNRLERMHNIYNSKDMQRQLSMLTAFQNMLNTETKAYEHENEVIQSVMGNYVEFTRAGDWRVAVVPRDAKGNIAEVSPDFMAVLPVTFTKSEREAQQLQAELKEELAGKHTMKDAAGDPIEVTFDITVGKAPNTATLPEAPDIQAFMRVADIVGLKLGANEMKKIANMIEGAAGRKRFGLQRAGTPGMDANILKNNSATMTRRAWRAAKTSQSWMIDSVFADNKNKYGDWDYLKNLQDKFDAANNAAVRNPAAVYLAETKLIRYANQLRHMATHSIDRPTVNIRTTKGEQKLKIEPEAEAHVQHAQALRESLEKGDLELNLNDLLSKTGPLRMFAVVMQLGNIASGLMNAGTLVTHLPWVLNSQHTKTGYGEGFSMSEISKEIMTAMTQVMPIWKNLSDSAKVKELLDKANAGDTSFGLTVPELEFMYKETLDGLLAPQQTYSMTGGTESNIGSLMVRNFAEMLLGPFSAFEAANRRVSALATYRLAKQRYIASGVSEDLLRHEMTLDPKTGDYKIKGLSEVSPEYKQLLEDVERVVYQSQGDYSNINRPKAFRGDLTQYVMMYKMFPLMTQLMLWNMPVKQQLMFLGVLFLLGGLKGEPFADDLMDIYDTILQKLGLRHDSVELELIQGLEKIMPGSSGWIMHGFIDNLAFGGTMSSRLSMGDIIPMTGAFREGADLNREVMQAFGPAAAANADILEWGWAVADFSMQLAGFKPRTTTWEQVFIRQNPQSQLRAIGEAGLMLRDGEITDPRGRLVSDDVTAFSTLSRAIGFYPLEATKANTAVRLDRMHIGFMRSVRARYILAYANAYRANDTAAMERLNNSVANWNENARATGQEDMMIRNFRSAANRAGRLAASTTIERTASGAPSYSVLEEVAGILNADEESEDD